MCRLELQSFQKSENYMSCIVFFSRHFKEGYFKNYMPGEVEGAGKRSCTDRTNRSREVIEPGKGFPGRKAVHVLLRSTRPFPSTETGSRCEGVLGHRERL